jgi:hypothetical protein
VFRLSKDNVENIKFVTLIFFIQLVYFWRDIASTSLSYFRDLGVILLGIEELRRKLKQDSFFPEWNPYAVLGKPFSADPLSGVYYPPNWFFDLFSLPLGFQLNILFHFFIAGVGTYFLSLKLFSRLELNYTKGAAFLSAISFSLGGYLISSQAYPNALYSSAWLSLALLLTIKCCETSKLFLVYPCLLGMTLLMIVIGAMPEVLIVYSCLAIAAPFVVKERARVSQLLLAVLLTCGVFILIGALPLYEFRQFFNESQRSLGLTPRAILRYSFDLSRLSEYIAAPINKGGLHTLCRPSDVACAESEWGVSIYLGILPLFFLFALLKMRRSMALMIVVVLIIFILVSAAGEFSFASDLISQHEFLRIIRYPEKLLLLPHFLISIGAGFGILYAAKSKENLESFKQLVLIMLLLLALLWSIRNIEDLPMIEVPNFLLVLTLFVAPYTNDGKFYRTFATIVAVILLFNAHLNIFPKAKWSEIKKAPIWLAELKEHPTPYIRVYSDILSYKAPFAAFDDFRKRFSLLQFSSGSLLANSEGIGAVANLNAPSSVNLIFDENLIRSIEKQAADQAFKSLRELGVDYVITNRAIRSVAGLEWVKQSEIGVDEGAIQSSYIYQIHTAEIRNKLTNKFFVDNLNFKLKNFSYQPGEVKIEYLYTKNEKNRDNIQTIFELLERNHHDWRFFVNGDSISSATDKVTIRLPFTIQLQGMGEDKVSIFLKYKKWYRDFYVGISLFGVCILLALVIMNVSRLDFNCRSL